MFAIRVGSSNCALDIGGGALLGQSTRGAASPPEPASTDPAIGELAVVDREADNVAILCDRSGPPSKSTLRRPTESEAATLVAHNARAAIIFPLTRNGAPWGHVGCYHRLPRHVGVERRSIAGLFARIISLRIEIAELRGVA